MLLHETKKNYLLGKAFLACIASPEFNWSTESGLKFLKEVSDKLSFFPGIPPNNEIHGIIFNQVFEQHKAWIENTEVSTLINYIFSEASNTLNNY